MNRKEQIDLIPQKAESLKQRNEWKSIPKTLCKRLEKKVTIVGGRSQLPTSTGVSEEVNEANRFETISEVIKEENS